MKDSLKLITELKIIELTASEFEAARHWKAGRCKDGYRRWGHLILIIINALLASIIFSYFKDILGEQVFTIVSAGLSLLAAIISALMLQFRPDEQLVGHKTMGNQFSAISRDARILVHQLETDHKLVSQGWELLDKLTERYNSARQLGEQFHVGAKITQHFYNEVEPKRKLLLEKLEKL